MNAAHLRRRGATLRVLFVRQSWFVGILAALALPAQAQNAATQEAAAKPLLAVRVADEGDKPVDGAEVYLIQNEDFPLSRVWIAAGGGRAEFGSGDLSGDPSKPYTGKARAIVRAPGYAPAIQPFELPRGEPLVIRLTRGKRMELRLRAPQGGVLPESLVPVTYFANDALCAWLGVRGWQRGDDMRVVFNASPMEALGDGRYSFQASEGGADFYVMVSHPGFLRAFRAGPFGKEDVARGKIEIGLPRAGTVRATFGGAPGKEVKPEDEPLGLGLSVYGELGPEDRAYFPLESSSERGSSVARTWADLAPGTYMVEGFEGDAAAGRRREKGRFREARTVELAAGDEKTVEFAFAAFDEAAAREKARGDYSAAITVQRLDGSPAADLPYKLAIYQGRYSVDLMLAEGRTDALGRFEIGGLAGGERAVAVDLTVGDQEVGQVELDGDEKRRKLEFRLPPRAGDLAPDLVLQDVFGEGRVKLSDFRGQVVLLDFWATWCGPCQAPMQHSSEVIARRGKDWAGKAVILGASIDDKPELAEKHCRTRGWNNVRQLWCCEGKAGWRCDAVKAYGVRGVPTALLLDAAGRIVWRGHPGTVDVEVEIDKLLKAREAGGATSKASESGK